MHYEDHTTGIMIASAKKELQFHSLELSPAKSLHAEAFHYRGLPGNEESGVWGSTE
jgi:hypothetical protein